MKKAFDPKQYLFMAILFSPFPVFYMSFKNSHILAEGDQFWPKMKGLFFAFTALIIGNYALNVYALVEMMNAIPDLLSRDPSLVYDVMHGRTTTLMTMIEPHINLIAQYGGLIFSALYIVILIITIKHVNKIERPSFEQAQKNELIETSNLVIPAIIGIISTTAIFLASDYIVGQIAQMLV